MNEDENYDRVIAAIPSFAGQAHDDELRVLEVASALRCGRLRLDELDEGVLEHAVGVLGIDTFVELAFREAEPEPVPVVAGIPNAIAREPASEEGALLGYFLRLLPQARDLIARWFEQPSLRLLPQVAGEGVVLDIRTPGPIYVSLLGDIGEAGWRSRLFADADGAMVHPLSDGPAEARDAVTFQDGRVAVDLASFPADARWRAFYLAQDHPAGCGEDERELFILRRAAGEQPTKPGARKAVGKMVELILQGRVLDAWREAADEQGMDDARLEVLVSMIYSQMEVLLGTAKAEVMGSLIDQSLKSPLTSDLKSLPSLLDSFKQVLMERMRGRIEPAE